MKFSLRPSPVCRALAALACLTVLTALPLRAANRFWIDPAGGPFSDTANWSTTAGGAGGAGIPGAADVANFTLNNTCTVTFANSVTNNSLSVVNGNITFDLDFHNYTLTLDHSEIGGVAGQTGRLTVRDGILGVDNGNDQLWLGSVPGSTGILTIAGNARLGNGTANPSILVGYQGSGTLTVSDNGRFDVINCLVGREAGAAGTVNITGPNAAGNAGGEVSIGSAGSGVLAVSSGGTLTGTYATLGEVLGADGVATVSGLGSSWAISNLTMIGQAGDGTLVASSGGQISSAALVTLGFSATGFGTATVTGANSLWNQAAGTTIGRDGLGVVTVSGGGRIVTSGGALLGANAGSEGRATVTGIGSQWTGTSALTIGGAGSGDLTVSAGAGVSTTFLNPGAGSGGGRVTVTGAGSILNADSVNIATGGNGTLRVADGARAFVQSGFTISNPAGAPVGTLELDGGSMFVTDDFTNNGVFSFSDGLLQIKEGFFWSGANPAPFTLDGADNDDLPILELDGAGGKNITLLTVGKKHRGKLLLRNWTVVDLGTSEINIGADTGGDGTIIVESFAQLNTTGRLLINASSFGGGGGKGLLEVNGGWVRAGRTFLEEDGTIRLISGHLLVESLVGRGRFDWIGGTLTFTTDTTLFASSVTSLLGTDATLRDNQELASDLGKTLTLETPLVVDGGSFFPSVFDNHSTLEVRSGSAFLPNSSTNSSGALLHVEGNLRLSGTFTNAAGARIELEGGTIRPYDLSSGHVQNNGLIVGDGTIVAPLTNNAGGRIRIASGESLFCTGTFSPNAGDLNLQGGILDITGPVTNGATGFISGRGVLFTGGLTNNGQMAFSGGTTDIFGDVTLTAGSRAVTGGAGSITTFYDDVVHNGQEIYTGINCSTVFFGAQSGAGPFTGPGSIYYIGDLRPGNSPATITYGGDVVLSPSVSLTMEISGTVRGTHYDSLSIARTLYADGGLTVALTGGFAPQLDQSFRLFEAAAIQSTFQTLTLPSLPAGLAWDIAQLYTGGLIRVVPDGLTFAKWAATVLGNPTATPGGDHDHDGWDNAAEFALGLFPPQAGTVLPEGSLITSGDGERLRYHFSRPLDRTGLTLKVQASSDLTNWDDLAVSINSAPFTGAGFVSENRSHPLSAPGMVEVRDILTSSTAPRRQIRLLITLSGP